MLSGLAQRSDSKFEYLLVKRDATGHEHVLWRGDSWIAAAVPVDDHRILISTISYQHGLTLIDLQ